MKRILRVFIIETFALLITSNIAEGIVFGKGVETLLVAGAALTAASLLFKPVINLLLLPINLVTFNLFKWVSTLIALYVVTLIVPGFEILKFSYSGVSNALIDLPLVELGGIAAFIAFGLILSIITGIVYWIAK